MAREGRGGAQEAASRKHRWLLEALSRRRGQPGSRAHGERGWKARVFWGFASKKPDGAPRRGGSCASRSRRQGSRSLVSETQEQGPDEAGAGGSRGPAWGSVGPGAALSCPCGTQPLSIEPEPRALWSPEAFRDLENPQPSSSSERQAPRRARMLPPAKCADAQGLRLSGAVGCVAGARACSPCPWVSSRLSLPPAPPLPSSQQTQSFTPPLLPGRGLQRRGDLPAAAGFAESWR